jgi:hypothetical protein
VLKVTAASICTKPVLVLVSITHFKVATGCKLFVVVIAFGEQSVSVPRCGYWKVAPAGRKLMTTSVTSGASESNKASSQ